MKTIAQFVAAGISTLPDLKAALEIAMQLEFATIPPYLCAQWSIDPSKDPSDIDGRIQDIVVQEMYHFALAGNMLSAIGGTPNFANAKFLPTYPTNVLPGDIAQTLAVDLLPLSLDQLKVFLQIENPQFTPLGLERAKGPATIGEFYDTIAAGFTTVNPAIDLNARFVDFDEAVQIKTIQDALDAIARIKGEGEGTEASPDQPVVDGKQLAHYYRFKEVLKGKSFVQTAGKWGFDGPDVHFPGVINFARSTATPNPSIAFNQFLSQFLIGLQASWTTGAGVNTQAMQVLRKLGTDLIKQGITPEFVWAD